MAFLASDRSGYTSGVIYTVDGGISAGWGRRPTVAKPRHSGARGAPGIHTLDGGYGFRACAKRRIPE